jgi:predicted DNA-binding transcriptional regulator YafY
MLETSARLLRLLSLLQVHRDWTGADLASRLDVTPRTLRRDVDKLRSLGYPVHANPGVGGGYRLGPGSSLPPLLLDDEEAIAVAVGLRSAAVGTVQGVGEASVRALAKIDQVLPPQLRRRVETLGAVMVPMTGFEAPAVSAAALTLLASACRDRQRVRFDYTTRDGAAARREAEPHRLVHTGRRWYLVAYDLGRADWRTFRVDRMTPHEPIGPRFEPREPPSEDAAAWASWELGVDQYRYQVRFVMHAPMAVVAERVAPGSGVVEAIDDRTCALNTGSNSLDALLLHVAVMGFEFEVAEGPEELRERVREVAGRLANSVGA